MALVKIVNWEGGSNARYDVNQMERLPDGRYTTDGYYFDSEGRPLSGGVPGDGPGQWTDGLPGARGGSGPNDGGGGGGGGGSSSAYYQQVKSILDAQSAAQRAETKAAIQQALIGFGLVPEGFQDKMNALDDLTRELIQKNTDSGISTYARLLEGREDSIKDIVNRLTARGLRRSGARGNRLRRGQLDFDRIFQDSLQQLLGTTTGLFNRFTQDEYGRQLSLAQALSQSFYGPNSSGPRQAPRSNGSFFIPNTSGSQAVSPALKGQLSNQTPTYSNPFDRFS